MTSAAMAAVTISSSQAADLAVSPYYTKAAAAPAVAAAIYDWSGHYVGVNAGYASGHGCWTSYTDAQHTVGTYNPDWVSSDHPDGMRYTTQTIMGADAQLGCHNSTGATVGGQFGYRWQAKNWVFGVEAQGNWADVSGRNVAHTDSTNVSPFLDPAYTNGGINRTKINSFTLLTGSVGVALNNVLLYVKGGGAYVDTSYRYEAPPDVAANRPQVSHVTAITEGRWSPVVGAGIEYGFSPNWTIGAEYNHIFQSDKPVLMDCTDGNCLDKTSRFRITQDLDMVLVRLNYRFGGPKADSAAVSNYGLAAPSMAAAVYDWSGHYIGVNAGYGSAHGCWSVEDPTSVGCHNSTGATVGAQLGYRWQLKNWVFGVEAQGNWAALSGSNVANTNIDWTNGVTNRTKIDSFALLTGSVGVALNNVLLYVKGGGAYVNTNYERLGSPEYTTTGNYTGNASQVRWNPVVGAGVEYGFSPNWTIGAEYNHVFRSDKQVLMDCSDLGHTCLGETAHFQMTQDLDMVLVRLNYRFGGPRVARY